jgi:hypothetical protein
MAPSVAPDIALDRKAVDHRAELDRIVADILDAVVSNDRKLPSVDRSRPHLW